ncbi:cytochrome bd-I oxidase subunit CydX [Ancylobacter sp. SL191]|jgi:cyd operon protein YbgT|nr:cytochrome bd-I oxidase subunit CydX [Ancylobacter sp. SL191]WAC27005.1 cytochrome bd-I oxidase subunit CydX [Ancylobacter sp. SL191]
MWYFAWMLGLPLAAAFAVLNAMWYELMDDAALKGHPKVAPAPVKVH